jgi:hypothetical protein
LWQPHQTDNLQELLHNSSIKKYIQRYSFLNLSCMYVFTFYFKEMMSRIFCLCSLVASFFRMFWTPVYATTVDPWDSPFISQTDDGAAEDINVIWSTTQQKDAVVNIVKSAVNRVLGILALLALIVLLYGGFLMVTAAWNDDQYNKWFTILKHAAIGILLIGVAWFIVSIVFWLVNLFTTTAEWTDAWTSS